MSYFFFVCERNSQTKENKFILNDFYDNLLSCLDRYKPVFPLVLLSI